jgi:hypothetical protein
MLEVHSCSAEERRYVVAGNPTHVFLRWRQKGAEEGGGDKRVPRQWCPILFRALQRSHPVFTGSSGGSTRALTFSVVSTVVFLFLITGQRVFRVWTQ